jgi:hypothetical protein
MAIDLRLAGRVLTVTVNGESASIDLANIRGDDGIRGPQGPSGDASSVTALEATVNAHTEAANPHSGAVNKAGDVMTGSLSTTHWLGISAQATDTDGAADAVYVYNNANADSGGLKYGGSNWSDTYNYMVLSKTKSEFLRPLTLQSGGLGQGFANEAALKTYLKTLLGLN